MLRLCVSHRCRRSINGKKKTCRTEETVRSRLQQYPASQLLATRLSHHTRNSEFKVTSVAVDAISRTQVAMLFVAVGSNETKSHTQTEKIFKFTNESLRLCYFFCLYLTFTNTRNCRMSQHWQMRDCAVVLLLLLLI